MVSALECEANVLCSIHSSDEVLKVSTWTDNRLCSLWTEEVFIIFSLKCVMSTTYSTKQLEYIYII